MSRDLLRIGVHQSRDINVLLSYLKFLRFFLSFLKVSGRFPSCRNYFESIASKFVSRGFFASSRRFSQAVKSFLQVDVAKCVH